MPGAQRLTPGLHDPVSRTSAIEGTDPPPAFSVARRVNPAIEFLDQSAMLLAPLGKLEFNLAQPHASGLQIIDTGNRIS